MDLDETYKRLNKALLPEAFLQTQTAVNRAIGLHDIPKQWNEILDYENKFSALANISKAQALLANQANLFSIEQKMAFSMASGIYQNIAETVHNYQNLYAQQLSLSAQMMERWNKHEGIFNAQRFYEDQKKNWEVFSGGTFYTIINRHNKDAESVETTFSDIASLFEREDFIEEIIKVQPTIAAIERGDQAFKIRGPKEFLEWFINEIVIKQLGVKVKTAQTISDLVVAAIFLSGIVHSAYKEIKDADQKQIPIYQPNELGSFTISNSPGFIRPSNKMQQIAVYPVNTKLMILQTKKGWCLVEGQAIVKIRNNKKRTRIKITKVVRSWVEKRNLDLFE